MKRIKIKLMNYITFYTKILKKKVKQKVVIIMTYIMSGG